MRMWLKSMMLAVCLALGSQGVSLAEEMPSEKEVGAKFPERKWFENVHMAGFVDVYYGYNFNQPPSRQNELRNFDLRNDQFALNLAELVFHKDPEPVGFRIDLDYGPTTEWVHCSNTATGVTLNCGSLPTASSEEPFKNIQQAYVSWKPSSMWSIEAGKFVTHLGAEVIETKDNWNYSRSLLFAWAIPYYHAGLRISHTHENFWINGYIYNGWNNVVEDNAGKTFGAQLGLTPFEGLSIIQNWIGGPEPGVNENRHVLDTVITFTPMPMLSLMANYDYGWVKQVPVGDAIWSGVALYARIAPTENLAFIPRFEWFDDSDAGFATGTSQIVKEVTLTGEYKLYDNVLTRLEYRSDWSTVDFFDSDTGTNDTDTQDTVTLGLVYSF